MTKQEISKWKCRWRLAIYLMLLGSSRPYPRLIVEENGCSDDNDDDKGILYL